MDDLEIDLELNAALLGDTVQHEAELLGEESNLEAELLGDESDDNLDADLLDIEEPVKGELKEEREPFEALPRESSLFLHGVDDMSTDDIKSYCSDPPCDKIDWINDSSCNVVFSTAELAQECIKSLLLDDTIIDHITLVPAKKTFTKDGKELALFLRVSTDEDIKKRGAREKSRYYQIHGVRNELSQERVEARKEHLERMKQSGGDGRSVFDRLGSTKRKHEEKEEPTQKKQARELPEHLKNRLKM